MYSDLPEATELTAESSRADHCNILPCIFSFLCDIWAPSPNAYPGGSPRHPAPPQTDNKAGRYSDPHGLQPTRLLHPWDFPGKSTGVVSRSGGEKGLRGSGAGTLGVPLGGTRRVGGPWVRRSTGEGNGSPLQYSCLENPTDRPEVHPNPCPLSQ